MAVRNRNLGLGALRASEMRSPRALCAPSRTRAPRPASPSARVLIQTRRGVPRDGAARARPTPRDASLMSERAVAPRLANRPAYSGSCSRRGLSRRRRPRRFPRPDVEGEFVK